MNKKPAGSGLLAALGLIARVSTAAGCLGQYARFTGLFAHVRVQYLVGLIGLAIVFLMSKRRMMAGVFLAFAAIDFAAMARAPFGESETGSDGSVTTLVAVIKGPHPSVRKAKALILLIPSSRPSPGGKRYRGLATSSPARRV